LDLETVELREPPRERASAARASPRLRADAEPAPIPQTASVRRRHERRPSQTGEEDPLAFDRVASLARNAGIVAHACLEKIAREGAGTWSPERIEAERPAIGRRLAKLGTPPAELQDAEALVLRALVTTLEDEVGRWILHGHDQARSEWKLTRWDPEALSRVDVTNASIDRSFVDRDVRWIVDYKVVEPSPGEDRGKFFDKKHEQYRDQLESYADLVRGLEPQHPIELGLYFPLLGTAIWWPAGASTWRADP
jgi:ATP-dependent exoDNAse (exonuclease V) beta subunit